MPAASCRLFVIPARDAPTAVILRRGPSNWYHLILWDMQDDSFADGAWYKGRLYEEKCDLSPDGRLFVYSAYKTKGGVRPTYPGCYTAVSRPPWLHALALWPQSDTYGGGGRFVGNRQLQLRVENVTHPNHPVQGIEIVDGYSDLRRSTDEVPGADWSGTDHRGRIIYTKGGQLYRRSGAEDVQLADFTNRRPNPQPSPDWAKEPAGVPRSGKRRRRK